MVTSEVAMASWTGAFAAIVASIIAFLSYKLSKCLYEEFKSDEIIIAGPLHHPDLLHKEYRDCVLRCTLFNKSKRKACIYAVEAFDRNGEIIRIKWSNAINDFGDPINPTELLGLVDSVNLVFRRIDGKQFQKTDVHIKHSFSSAMLCISFDPHKP
jgi:hypothetical protein